MSRAQALVLAGHGSQRHPAAAAPLHDHADRIRGSGRFDEVAVAFWKEEPWLRDATAVVAADVAYVVPVLSSEGYFADGVFPRELGVDDAGAGADDVDVRYAEPVGTHDALADVIAARAEAALAGPPEAAAVVLVGHGTERHARSARATREHARRLRERGRYAEVCALFLDEAPHVGDFDDHVAADEVAAVPFFVADGGHTTRDIPAAIGHPGIGETATLHGRRVHYTGAVGTEPALAEVIVERAVEAGAAVSPEPRHRGLPEAGDAFVRWVDARPDSVTWGEVAIAERADGYELMHRDDVGRARDALEPVGSPRELRARVRADDRGRYRPLSGADTLPSGWVLAGLDPHGLVRTLELVYPASVAHWWSERQEALDVTHFRETAARQTGIYADLDGLDGEVLDAAAEAVCGTCVRSRRWEAATDEPTDGGDEHADGHPEDGTIPCREACPFLLSAAHAFCEAAADEDGRGPEPGAPVDPDVPAGAFHEPGNRHRVRFARALARRQGADGVGSDAADGRDPMAVPTGGDN